MRRKGFTLIELLVVIAIIAILAAILFPVFARARENARRSSCQSNLKQIALGVAQYSQDYDEKFPMYAAAHTAERGWSILLDPYLKSSQILQCPSDAAAAPTATNADGWVDYAYNIDLGYNGAPEGMSLAALTQTTLTVMLVDESQSGAGDARHWSAGCVAKDNTDTTCPAGLATFRGTKTDIHLDGQNYAFTDGHVKWYKAASPTQSAKVYNRWANSTNSPASVGSPTFNPSP